MTNDRTRSQPFQALSSKVQLQVRTARRNCPPYAAIYAAIDGKPYWINSDLSISEYGPSDAVIIAA